MIIFDRFLCCIGLKFFGKFIGWIGTMTTVMIAYAIFLVSGAKKPTFDSLIERMAIEQKFGVKINADGKSFESSSKLPDT